CGGVPPPSSKKQTKDPLPPGRVGYGYALTTRGGTYNDGSGRIGVALLATLRDSAGAGPSAPWRLKTTNSEGDVVSLSYDDASPGSFITWWSEDAAAAWNDTYRVTVTDAGGDTLSDAFVVADS